MPLTMHATGHLYVMERFDAMPRKAHRALKRRTEEVTATLYSRVIEATPVKTGELRSEIHSRVYSDSPKRVAGYVYVAAANQKEIAKAASLEYGIKGTRRQIPDDAHGVWMRRRHGKGSLKARLSGGVHLRARRYLRGPFSETAPEYEAAVAEVMGTQVAEANAEFS